jgi:hypothetical protein
VIQAASLAFLGRPALPSGPWDEYPAWLGLPEATALMTNRYPSAWRIERMGEWASLRARRYASRPAHADQLHVDLWFQGRNILMDAGTYAYNLQPPWDNGLACAAAHNSLVLDGGEPMRRAGRFLWLGWDQADWDPAANLPNQRLSAWRDGYKRLGFRHRRSLEWLTPGQWQVIDELLALRPVRGAHQALLHWLLPDGEWRLEGQTLILELGFVRLTVALDWAPEEVNETRLRLIRAGQVIHGPPGEFERLGWTSPTYLVRVPALSFQAELEFQQRLRITTRISLNALSEGNNKPTCILVRP